MFYPYQIKSIEAYQKLYDKSVSHPENFWSDIATHFQWHRKWDKVLDWSFKEDDLHIEWFKGARLNITENCLDRHLELNGNKNAIIWVPNNPDDRPRILTYNVLFKKVCQFANVLKNNGVKKGDSVCIYMGMISELAIAMLACARIGAVHSVVFGGFSAKSISERIHDCNAHYVITCDGSFHGKKVVPLKDIIDDALISCPDVKRVIVRTRTHTPISMIKGRDVWWEDEIAEVESLGMETCAAEDMEAEDPLFVLYTSGSTGKPKGVVHSSAGYMVYTTYAFVNVLQFDPHDVHFATADIGWITGHSFVVYGPLLAGGTTVIYEGIPVYPDAESIWKIVERFHVNTLYTAPTVIRSLMSFGDEPVDRHDISSLKVLGSAGEPLNEEAWNWYNRKIGGGLVPVVDSWWQTETAAPMISNLAGITPGIPGTATLPLPGVQPLLVDAEGKEITEQEASGNLCIKFPWPSMIRTTYGDHERFKQAYFTTFPGYYFTGDGASRDEKGNYKLTGRVDDVLNVSGHRIGTAELENAINMHNGVVESAVVGYPHGLKGQGIYAYVIFKSGHQIDQEEIKNSILATVSRIIGAIAKPDKIQFVEALPKTRSGKIVRRILRKIAENDIQNLGDISTLQDAEVIDTIWNDRL